MNNNLISNYLNEQDEELVTLMETAKFVNRQSLISLPISNQSLMNKRAKGLHAIECNLEYNICGDRFIKIRVITNTSRGVNVRIRCASKEIYQKYLDLRLQIRNRDYVVVLFDDLYVVGCYKKYEISLLAHDFEIVEMKN